MTDVLIDGDIYVAEDGEVARVIPASGWDVDPPEDGAVRPNTDFTMISSPDRPDGSSSRRNGVLYAFDARNHRVVAFNKADGKYLEQYRPAGGDDAWEDLRGFTVLPAAEADAPSTMWWISRDGPPLDAPRGGPRRPAHALAQRRGLPRRDAEGDQDPQAVTAGRPIRP